MTEMDRSDRPLSGQERDRLENFVEGENDFGWEPMPLDMLQGFMCGIASASKEVPPDQWLPWVLGIDPWPDAREGTQEWFDLAKRYYREQVSTLDGLVDAELVFYEPDESGRDNQFTFWCVGFLDGLIVESEPLEEVGDPEEVNELLFPLRVLANALEDSERKQFTDKQWAKLVEESGNEFWPSVIATYRYGNALRRRPSTMRRESPKIGRNDPCHCGSGKKYKNCHGKSGTTS